MHRMSASRGANTAMPSRKEDGHSRLQLLLLLHAIWMLLYDFETVESGTRVKV
jgi:hypothetical protein